MRSVMRCGALLIVYGVGVACVLIDEPWLAVATLTLAALLSLDVYSR